MKDAMYLYDLFDIYKGLLSPRQQEAFSLRYNDDLTLAEIAEILSVTRQGAHETISRVEDTLLKTEAKLGFLARETALRVQLQELEWLTEDGDRDAIRKKVAAILALMED